MKQSDIWAAVPQYAKDKYYEMQATHKRMCANVTYEPREARALRREMNIFYRFQCEAAEKRLKGGGALLDAKASMQSG